MIQRPTPAIVSQAAVRALPRWAVGLVCVLFLLPGFVGRDPWRAYELAAFAVMLDMAWLQGPWLSPQVLGQAAEQWGLLPYWLGALSIQVFSGMDAAWASKLPFMGLTALTLWATWHSAFFLAVQPAAQPVTFAFGGEAHPRDYARALADGSLLLLVACLGLALLAHETTIDTAKLAFAALWLLSWVRLLVKGYQHKTLLYWTVGSLGLALSGAPLLTVVLTIAATLALRKRPHQTNSLPIWQMLILTIPSLLVLWGMVQLGWAWLNGSWANAFTLANMRSMVELLTWFTWPAGILGLWALWKWRHHIGEAHIYVPSWVILAVLLTSFFQGSADRVLLLALPALAVLAAFALPTLKRSVIALVDWFAVLFFSLGAVFIWVMWLAMMTGIPAKPAANVARLAPSFNTEFSWVLFLPALLASLSWVSLIAWRIGRAQVALWKPVVLSASGAMLCWVLLMTLWLPLLNHGMGLAPLSQRIAQLTGTSSCVVLHGVSDTYVGALLYHGELQVVRTTQNQASDCKWLVVAPSAYEIPSPKLNWNEWAFVQTVPRLRESQESVLLLRRISAQ